MLGRKKIEELEVCVKLDEPLTSDSCCKLILELVKYLLYQKQQIPVSYEYLLRLGASSVGVNDRSLATARATLSCLENISEHLNTELCCESSAVKEIFISMGATILAPKFCLRVSLPPEILSGQCHFKQQHSPRKPLLNLMRSITESVDFQEAMALPLMPTNTFFLLQKRDCNKVSEFFLPKPRYAITNATAGSRLHLKLSHKSQEMRNCNCKNTVSVYRDRDASYSELAPSQNTDGHHSTEKIFEGGQDSIYQWYQSRDIIKGFKFSR
ncbi:MAD2L1-binding protein-like [Neodiprion virginianus]|uniref:MAD2L1-binding protein-like n=1 Tax=Neodiprion fabricii TaxID=2872261 RepID=UPI001ED8F93B|nr:MAD2L1-binding protein-like [Neodiprion fabricii]XP_046628543.1 MAD2L1-binding protein-like [Neodiprion virginianus]XP_046628544.1 MAD2L1-binding protein-like [Neodiprion virginianus]